jgi:DNA-binding response OmpR family regulator
MRVLHIEDDNFIAELYGRGLKAKGLVVDRVADTSDALAALDAMRYDAICSS